MAQKKTIEEIYQKKTQLEHILLRPDTYIGSVEHDRQQLWIYDRETAKFEFKMIQYVPGLYKIFDEILVNAADNFQRDPKMNMIKVDIDQANNLISVWNNGKGIPIEIHKEHNCYVPEMIFGQLLTSSNYNDKEQKVTGGRNGFGAKLANIFSTEFVIETGDARRNKYFKQTFYNNMARKDEPILTRNEEGVDFTRVSFRADLSKFNMTHLDDDIISLMTKRVYDLAGVTDAKVRVKLNGTTIDCKNFTEYSDYYLQNEENKELPKIVEQKSDRWQVVCSLSDGAFQQVSFVNSICTTKGGTHVDYIANQIVAKIMAAVVKKNKKIQIKPHQIRANLWLFVNCLVVNPAFDSQTKETLNTKAANFGSTYELTDKFMKEVMNSGVVELILQVAQAKEEAKMQKNLGPGKKKSKLMGIPKLEDANQAGTREGHKCTIILTEGDSAKSLALAGIEVIGRDYYGCFPLKGKLLNVRDATAKQIGENAEIQNLIKIIGLQMGKKYTHDMLQQLRYGSIMIMTDQDHDGSHIKGLLINFIHKFWPSLMELDGFLVEFVTPIIKVFKGTACLRSFFTIPEYEAWMNEQVNTKNLKAKYYKGLGTSTAKEAKEYFSALAAHKIDFEYIDNEDMEVIDMAFNKKFADRRKTWLETYDPVLTYVDHSVEKLRYKDFVNKELILFSVADCLRSIPCLCDGLKPGMRKIMFACFKRKLKAEIKVAQLSGYVAEHSAYHHGEVSLQTTIVSLAQNFVGSNNINLLMPIGQFGTRNQGGKEAASARYIFTNLSPVTRHLFNEMDDNVLTFLEEEGQQIEPTFYLPIVPLSLINGSEGIGTGWSTFIPMHNPKDIVKNLKQMMQGLEPQRMKPWYKGFQGTIEPAEGREKSYICSGVYNVLSETELEITELPIGKWTRDYKNFLEELAQKDEIEDIREYHQENRVHFIVVVPKLMELERKPDGIEKKFKLQSSISCANFVLFNSKQKIFRYGTEIDILKEFFGQREALYSQRKAYMLARLSKDYEVLVNKVKFIQGVIAESLKINRVKRKILVKNMVDFGLKPMSEIHAIMLKFAQVGPQAHQKAIKAVAAEENQDADESIAATEDDVAEGEVEPKEFDYLLGMPMWSVTEERVEQLIKQMKDKKEEHDILYAKSIHQLWCGDLDAFTEELDKVWEQEELDRQKHGGVKNDGKKKRKAPAKKKVAIRNEPENEPISSKKRKPRSKTKEGATRGGQKVTQPAAKNPDDMTLRERMAAKFGKDNMQSSSLFSGKDGLSAAQMESKKLGIGHKRKAEETTIFKELNDMANQFENSDADEEEQKYNTNVKQPVDLVKRRKYATVDDEESSMSVHQQSKAMNRQQRQKTKPQNKRVIVDSDGEDSSQFSASDEDEAYMENDSMRI